MNWIKRLFGKKKDTRFYGGKGTIHQTGYVNVETDKDGAVVSVWFRCLALPFDQTIVSEGRAIEMRRMYTEYSSAHIVGIEMGKPNDAA